MENHQGVVIGADHAGFALKEEMKRWLREWDCRVIEDVGAYALDPNDGYPEYAFAVAERVAADNTRRGVLICGSGQGVCTAANKVRGIRASIVGDAEEARLSRAHGNTNVLCFAGWNADHAVIREALRVWLETPFSNEERHVRRLRQITDYESRT
ncbi:MAG: RpiB/LacA/LacB family sugar-phosphate isomerase [Candidatus Uhrbacteria bacterium]